jgi:protein-ribulosamine 3-kinase
MQSPLPSELRSYLHSKYTILDACMVKGGSINEAVKLTTKSGVFFLKWNELFIPSFFEAEAKNLSLIESTRSIKTPTVVEFGDTGDAAFLLLEYIHSGAQSFKSMQLLGEQLAQFHLAKNTACGLNYPNYCGLVLQENTPTSSWTDFFVEYRLRPLVNQAFSRKLISLEEVSLFIKLFAALPQLFPDEAPSLLHGDLWNGNFLIDTNQTPYLIDPACYFGHREMDISMTLLFGGFDKTFYDAYQATYPLEKGWRDRMVLWNLYPLLVHLILFGDPYQQQIKAHLDAIAA